MIIATGKQSFARRYRLFLRWTRKLLFITGALAVSYVALTVLRAKLYQDAAVDALDKQIHAQEQDQVNPTPTVAKQGDVLGRIEIPRLGMMVAILEGTRWKTLQLGVGHIEGTAFPGEPGNIGIAGHRDTFFHALKDIRIPFYRCSSGPICSACTQGIDFSVGIAMIFVGKRRQSATLRLDCFVPNAIASIKSSC